MVDISSLFLHVLAAIGIVGGGVMQVMAGVRLRAAESAAEVALWARFARNAGVLIAGSALVSLLTGGHLAGAVWTTEAVSGFSYPFITLGVAGLVLLAPIGPMVGGAQLRRLEAYAGAVADSGDREEIGAPAGNPVDPDADSQGADADAAGPGTGAGVPAPRADLAGLLAAARSPRLWGPVHSLVGVGVALVALMVYKPGWFTGALLLVVGFAVGWVAGAVAAAHAGDTGHPGARRAPGA